MERGHALEIDNACTLPLDETPSLDSCTLCTTLSRFRRIAGAVSGLRTPANSGHIEK